MATVAELRQILKEDSNGKNLYDHLTETLMKVRHYLDRHQIGCGIIYWLEFSLCIVSSLVMER